MQAILALYTARRTSGIVVNIGFHCTSVVPSKILWSLSCIHHNCKTDMKILVAACWNSDPPGPRKFSLSDLRPV